MAAPKGHKHYGGGRKKGQPNKITTDVRTAIQEAFIAAGGVKYLKSIAKSDPAVFCRLLGMTLPKDVNFTGTMTLVDLLTAAERKISELPAELPGVTH